MTLPFKTQPESGQQGDKRPSQQKGQIFRRNMSTLNAQSTKRLVEPQQSHEFIRLPARSVSLGNLPGQISHNLQGTTLLMRLGHFPPSQRCVDGAQQILASHPVARVQRRNVPRIRAQQGTALGGPPGSESGTKRSDGTAPPFPGPESGISSPRLRREALS